MTSVRIQGLWLALALATAGCGGGEADCEGSACDGRTQVCMDFASTDDFYAAPFPTDARGVQGFPNPRQNDLVSRLVSMAESADGFGLTSGLFFQLTAPLDPAGLPSLSESVAPGSPVALIGIDPASPDYSKRYPVSIAFLADGGPYGAPSLLALLPLQGVPLRPKTRYAAVVMDALHDTKGRAIGPSAAMRALAAGRRPAGLGDDGWDSYQAALSALDAASIDVRHVAGLAAFTTGSPATALGKVLAAMNATPPAPDAPFAPAEVFPTFCVYASTIGMPEYQRGDPPYADDGGEWVFDASGNPVLQRTEVANFVVTIPRVPMPAAGYPVVVLSRTGAGGERPLVDRGVQGFTGGPALEPGTGPALYFASAGFAGASIDGPLGGLRNTTGANEDFTIFNVGNPAALRDNVRQSAAELALEAHVLDQISIDVSGCPGAVAPGNTAHFDVATMALMGHSMGATIAPLTLAFEPRYRAGLLSGAGGSWIENVIYKQKPVAVKGIASVLVGIAGSGYELNEHDPLLSLFQWSCEAADPPVYSRRITLEPSDGAARHVLMMQGIVDHYIMPPIADAESLSLGLDLAGDELDDTVLEIAELSPLGPLLPLVDRQQIGLPASANLTSADGSKVTAVVTQHLEDGVEDGHEVAFQTDPPKHEYICFLKGLSQGTPIVPSAGKADDPCP
jgi:hypothetical protein